MSALPTLEAPTTTALEPHNSFFASRLTDDQLAAEVTRLARCERRATVDLVVHLAEFDVRRLYLGAGFSSLFAYCTTVLRLSEHEAYNRITAARSSRRYPILLDRLRDGAINLITIRLLAPHLSPENHRDLIDRAHGKSKLEVEELLASRFPQPPEPASVRKVPTRHESAPIHEPGDAMGSTMAVRFETDQSSAAPVCLESHCSAAPPDAGWSQVSARTVVAARGTVSPLSEAHYKISFTATAETREKLRRAQDLLRHQVPDGDLARVFDRALSVLLDELERRKIARKQVTARDAKTTAVPASGSRHIPAEVRRGVWARDGGRCAFQSETGRRCQERGGLEFHHLRPYAAGGEACVSNISQRCRAHNGYESELYYGPTRDHEPAGVAAPTRSGTSRLPATSGASPG